MNFIKQRLYLRPHILQINSSQQPWDKFILGLSKLLGNQWSCGYEQSWKTKGSITVPAGLELLCVGLRVEPSLYFLSTLPFIDQWPHIMLSPTHTPASPPKSSFVSEMNEASPILSIEQKEVLKMTIRWNISELYFEKINQDIPFPETKLRFRNCKGQQIKRIKN